MAAIPKRLLAWIASLLPKQEARGAGSMQVGKVGGNFTVVNMHPVVPIPPSPPVPTAAVPTSIATQEQREVLAMIRRLPNRDAVFDFMQRSFNTRMVIDLQPVQLLRVRRYVEVVERNRVRSKERA